MPVQISNLTQKLVLIRLNSGQTVHIGARQQSEFADADVKDNPMVKKIAEKNIISVEETQSSEITVTPPTEKKKIPATREKGKSRRK